MIQRYTRDGMRRVWSDAHRYETWLAVEIAALEGWAALGAVPPAAVEAVKARARVDPARIDEIEKTTQHDMIAFVEQVSSTVGPEGACIHFGLTSSDVLDTAAALILREAGEILCAGVEELRAALREKALRYRRLPVMGRTHGIHAEPTTLGCKFAGWYWEMTRNAARLRRAIEEVSVGKLSGAVGTYSNIDPRVEEYVCAKLGLGVERFAGQVVARDRYAAYLSAVALTAASAERIALQIRLLQQTELSEAAEPFGKGQKGSSAMPHKRNPILCERICGLARVIKNNAGAGLENVALWHERDISHSSAERVILPDSTTLLDYILSLLTRVVAGIEVFPERIERNLRSLRGVIFSQTLLNTLVDRGMERAAAYAIVQKNAFAALRGDREMIDLVKADPEVSGRLEPGEIDACFDLERLLRNIDRMFETLSP